MTTSPLTDIARRLRDAGRAAFWRGEGAHAIMSKLADELDDVVKGEAEATAREVQRGRRKSEANPSVEGPLAIRATHV